MDTTSASLLDESLPRLSARRRLIRKPIRRPTNCFEWPNRSLPQQSARAVVKLMSRPVTRDRAAYDEDLAERATIRHRRRKIDVAAVKCSTKMLLFLRMSKFNFMMLELGTDEFRFTFHRTLNISRRIRNIALVTFVQTIIILTTTTITK